MVKLLLDSGADVNKQDACNMLILARAINSNNFDIAYLLLQKGATVDQTYEGHTPLTLAINRKQ